MNKKLKIWFWTGLIIFILPELFWGTISNLLYEFTKTGSDVQPYRYNFLTNSGNVFWLGFIMILQFLGLMITIFSLIKSKKSKLIFVIMALFIFIAVINLFLIFLSFTLGGHGIG